LKLYKYLHSDYDMCAIGNIKIGTLMNYKEGEHKVGIADPDEGVKTVSHHIDYWNSSNPNAKHTNAMQAYDSLFVGGGVNNSATNVTMFRTLVSPDFYMLCLSMVRTKEAMQSCGNADSCVQITNFNSFISRLTDALNESCQVRLIYAGPVSYQSRIEEFNGEDWGLHPGLVKGPEFKPQEEFRVAWKPKHNVQISPIILNDIGLLKFCKKVPI